MDIIDGKCFAVQTNFKYACTRVRHDLFVFFDHKFIVQKWSNFQKTCPCDPCLNHTNHEFEVLKFCFSYSSASGLSCSLLQINRISSRCTLKYYMNISTKSDHMVCETPDNLTLKHVWDCQNFDILIQNYNISKR